MSNLAAGLIRHPLHTQARQLGTSISPFSLTSDSAFFLSAWNANKSC